MGIEKLRGSLLTEANDDAQKALGSAEAQAKAMLDAEHARCEAMKKEAAGDVERLLEEQRNERLAWGRLESKRILAEAKEDAIKNVLESFFAQLEKMGKNPEYRDFLKHAVDKALAELGHDSIVHVVKGERDIVAKAKSTKIVEDLEAIGGAVVESADRKIRIDLTLETLVEMQRDDIRKQAYDKLFGGK